MRTTVIATRLVIALLGVSAVAQRVSQTAPQPNRNITAQRTQKNLPTGADHPESTAGTVEGFVYWDANRYSHTPTGSCGGLAITVSVGSSSGGPLTSFTPLATLTNNFKYVGQVKEFLAGGKINVYDVCTYAYSHVPVGPDLQVSLAVTQPWVFSPVAVPQFAILGPLKIINAQCNMLPRIVNPTASDLMAHWGSCQNMAYDVNFVMHAAPRPPLGSSGGGTAPGTSGSQNGMVATAPQQGLLVGRTASQTLMQSTNGGLLGNQAQTSSASVPPTPASKVELNPQPLPPRTAANAGSGSPGTKVSLNPQPLPPKTKGTPRAIATLAPLNLAQPKALKKIANPRLSQQNSSIIAVLQQQRQAADQETVAMKLSLRSAASASTARTPALSASFQGNAPAQGLGPMKTQGAQGSSGSSITHLSPFNSTVLTCSTDPTPRILQVSGGQAPGIFTPEAKYNLYTIVGCSFGQSQPTNSAYIFGANGFKANLNIDYWSDNGITVHLDPGLGGVLDQNNVMLVVTPVGKQQLQKSGFKFYAARGMPAPDGSDQEVQLSYNSQPQSSVVLAYANAPIVIGWNQVPGNAKSQFPAFTFSGTPVVGWTFRYAYGHSDPNNPCFINDVHYAIDTCQWYFNQNHPGTDVWDFGKLTPGFAISSYNLYYEETDPSQMCGAWDDEATGDKDGLAGKWDFNLNSQNQIQVTWPLYYCHDREEVSSRENKQVMSSYGLAVWVMGPRCVDPWTGQKDSACLTKVHQMLQ